MGKIEVIDKSKYYRWNNLLSKGKLLNFAKGGTGIGKTYGAKEFMMKHYINKGETFMFMRRRANDFKNGNIENYFEKMPPELVEGWEVSKRDRTFKYKGETAGYFLSLFDAGKKAVEYPESLSWILFDEYVTHMKGQRYLDNEFTTFLQAYDAITRYTNQVRVLFTGNNCSIYNPYDLAIGMTEPKIGITTFKDKVGIRAEVAYDMIDSHGISDQLRKTRIGRMMEGTEYANYAFDNKSLFDSSDFIAKKGGNAYCLFTISVDGENYGIWYDKTIHCHFASVDTGGKLRFAATNSDHTPNTASVDMMKRNSAYKGMVESYNVGKLFFDCLKTKSAILKAMRITLGGRM